MMRGEAELLRLKSKNLWRFLSYLCSENKKHSVTKVTVTTTETSLVPLDGLKGPLPPCCSLLLLC